MLPSYKKEIFLFLTVFAAFFILYPLIDTQSVMATGDHGRDLYAARAVLNGQVPYKDYWWVYGPLMPYYYALCFLYLGVHVPALLMGKAFLALLSSVFVYLALTTAAVPCALAFIGALWFLAFFPEFGITYNHIGGTTLLLGLFYLIARYLMQPRAYLLFLSLGTVLLVSLVKLNFGATALFCLLVSVLAKDMTGKIALDNPKRIFYALAGLLPAIVFLIYWFFLNGLSAYEIRQCLPYLNDDQPYHLAIGDGLNLLSDIILRNITASWQDLLVAGLIIGSIGFSARWFLSAKPAERNPMLLIIAVLALFYLTSIHEFVLSGVSYRLVWAKPFAYLLMFVFLSLGARQLPKIIRGVVYTVFLLLLALQIFYSQQYIRSFKTPLHYLAVERGKVFLGNPPEWITTVTETTEYLKATLRKDELFFALPYDPLYYFLADKASPTRQLIFFDHIKIPPEQEKSVLAEIEARQVNWILLSSRHNAKEFGLGTFGQTYCPILAQYIAQNFEVVAEFGDWVNEPGWAWHHGTKVLKRISQ